MSVMSADVSMIGTWGEIELEVFRFMCSAVGVKVNFETTRDLDALIATRIASKNLLDIAILPNPSMLKRLAAQDVVKPITYVSREQLSKTTARTMMILEVMVGSFMGDS